MAETSCIKIEGGNLRGETLELGNHEQHDSIFGGAFLINCVVEIRGPAFDIVDANFLNCRINVLDRLSDIRFLESVFERCTFEGLFERCQFGYRRGESVSPNAYYRMCDFSNATLHLCDFYTGDIDSMIWPKWPNIAILNPRQNATDWKSIQFPEELKSMQGWVANPDGGEKQTADDEPLAVTIDLSRYEAVAPHMVRPLLESKLYIVFR